MTLLEIDVHDARPIRARCDSEHLHVALADGRTLIAPLWWYPRLMAAELSARNVIEFSPMGLHWPHLDEDISIASILRGQKAPGARAPQAAEAV